MRRTTMPWLIRACRASSPIRVFCSRARRLLDAVLVMASMMAMPTYRALTPRLFEADAPEASRGRDSRDVSPHSTPKLRPAANFTLTRRS